YSLNNGNMEPHLLHSYAVRHVIYGISPSHSYITNYATHGISSLH
ncbi:26336_t:CDS:1, partial [Gigaspora margarita]